MDEGICMSKRVTARTSTLGLFSALVAAGGLTLMAQTPTPPPGGAGAAGPADVQGRRGGGAAPAGAGAQGRGGGRGQVGVSLGGSMADDPAYATMDFSSKTPVKPLTPAEEAKKIWLPPGFKLEPVLTDPDIEESAQIAFDGNGRLYVLELRGYMQDADGGGTLLPIGRISRHEDRNNDGVYETHTVFVDKMVFPRFVLPFGADAVLSKESNADELWKFSDTNGDGVADKKELFATGFGRLANVEHQESHLYPAMDNWMYSTYNAFRARWTPSGVVKEPTGANQAQWGVTQDNYGKVWFQSGASGMPGYFQFPVVYGNFDNQQDRFEPDLNITWGAPVLVADMQGGMNSVRMPDGSLARATGSAGNDVFRGDRLPKDMIGDYFYGETVARIVRRLRPVKTEGFTQLKNVYPLSEFIRSTDPLFRPVDMTTAPDGTMYITDMYRGIIQESQWSGPGTYLRARIQQYQLDKVVRHGRIWRLTYEGIARDTRQPRMLSETPAQLVAHLSHPNGWWRDTAQQLLVLKQDKSVVPALKALATTSTNQLARVHALWTLEGLGSADAAMLRGLMKDPDPQIRQTAIRVSETVYKGGDKSFAADYKGLTKDADTNVVIQALLTINLLKVADGQATIKAIADANKAKGVQVVTGGILNAAPAGGRGGGGGAAPAMSPVETAALEKGKTIYGELCYACHGEDGRGEPMPGAPAGTTRAPALAGSPRVIGHRDYVIKTLLHGLTGPIDGDRYAEVMVPMGMNTDDWVASIGSYVRNSFGNRESFITASDVARVRTSTTGRTTSWTVEEALNSLPKQLVVDPAWKLTSSHNPATASYALSIQPWSSGVAQQPGMWLQVELPQAATLAEIQFESSALAEDSGPAVMGAPPRSGGGARAGGPAAPLEVGYPRGYQVQTSMDGVAWGAPVAQGQGSGTRTTITFAPTAAKFVRITQTGQGPTPWSVQRLRLYVAPAAR